MPRITPTLWFDTDGEAAAERYVSIFPNSRITNVVRYDASAYDPSRVGQVMLVEFELDGQPYAALNGGPQFTFSEAISLAVECADQAEVDRYWAALSDGGEEGPCGWLKDRWGVSWQIVPKAFMDILAGDDRERAERAGRAVMSMGKLDVATILAA